MPLSNTWLTNSPRCPPMTERIRPIIFSGPMVRALLDGRKSQTRRALKPQPVWREDDCFTDAGHPMLAAGWSWRVDDGGPSREHEKTAATQIMEYCSDKLPYAIGDLLWVRETCRAEELSRPAVTRPTTPKERRLLGRTQVTVSDELDGADGVRYLADDAWHKIENNLRAGNRWVDLYHYRNAPKGCFGSKVPSIHMPRWASRITLRVTDMGVQRVQDINHEDAVAEGFEIATQRRGMHPPSLERFRNFWDSLNAQRGCGWDTNPWVAALTFTVINQNVDQVLEAEAV